MTTEEKIKHVEAALKKENELRGIIGKSSFLYETVVSLDRIKKILNVEIKELLFIQHQEKQKSQPIESNNIEDPF